MSQLQLDTLVALVFRESFPSDAQLIGKEWEVEETPVQDSLLIIRSLLDPLQGQLEPLLHGDLVGGLLHALILEQAGLPKGVFHVLPGAAEAGEALVTDPLVPMISFTGSTAVGRRVGELAGRHLKKVALELGGKNALIICDDTDMEAAIANGSWASWLHQGQICMSTERIIVVDAVPSAVRVDQQISRNGGIAR